jgi:hypothetical protein
LPEEAFDEAVEEIVEAASVLVLVVESPRELCERVDERSIG